MAGQAKLASKTTPCLQLTAKAEYLLIKMRALFEDGEPKPGIDHTAEEMEKLLQEGQRRENYLEQPAGNHSDTAETLAAWHAVKSRLEAMLGSAQVVQQRAIEEAQKKEDETVAVDGCKKEDAAAFKMVGAQDNGKSTQHSDHSSGVNQVSRRSAGGGTSNISSISRISRQSVGSFRIKMRYYNRKVNEFLADKRYVASDRDWQEFARQVEHASQTAAATRDADLSQEPEEKAMEVLELVDLLDNLVAEGRAAIAARSDHMEQFQRPEAVEGQKGSSVASRTEGLGCDTQAMWDDFGFGEPKRVVTPDGNLGSTNLFRQQEGCKPRDTSIVGRGCGQGRRMVGSVGASSPLLRQSNRIFCRQMEPPPRGENPQLSSRGIESRRVVDLGEATSAQIGQPSDVWTNPLGQMVSILGDMQQRQEGSRHVMPKLEIRKFGGDVTEYLPWREYVQEAIILSRIPKAQQFLLLYSTLEGKAHDLVKNIGADGNAMDIALEILDEEYNSPKMVARGAFKKLDEAESIETGDYEALARYSTILESVARILKHQGLVHDLNSTHLIDTAILKLPHSLRRSYIRKQEKRSSAEIGRFRVGDSSELEELGRFIREEVRYLRQCMGAPKSKVETEKESMKHSEKPNGSSKRKDTSLSAAEGNPQEKKPSEPRVGCICCGGKPHPLFNCYVFKKWGANDRIAKAMEKGLCFGCLEKHSRNEECKKKGQSCGIGGCESKHHQLLHGAKTPRMLEREKKGEKKLKVEAEQADTSKLAAFSTTRVLRVVSVEVSGPRGSQVVGALLDSGNSRTGIDEKLAEKLGLKTEFGERTVYSVNSVEHGRSGCVSFRMRGKHETKWWNIENATTMKNFRLPRLQVGWADWAAKVPAFEGVEIEDVDYQNVKILLGVDYEELMVPIDGTKRRDKASQVLAFKTALGWTMSGPVGNDDVSCLRMEGKADILQLTEEFRLFSAVERFGILYGHQKKAYDIDRDVEELRRNTRLTEGRFTTRMLWKKDLVIPESENQARRRLSTLWGKLAKSGAEVLREKYCEGFVDNEKKGYIRKLSKEQARELREKPHWFLPHFVVFHPDKPEKPRRVLDAKAKNHGISLNDMLDTGPNLLNQILGVLMRFRLGKFAVNADVKEMFPQIRVPPEDEGMLAMLWKKAPDAEEEVYVNTRHIFGAKCSPSIANFCVREAVRDSPEKRLKELVEKSFYVDDFYAAFDSIKEANHFSSAVRDGLLRGGFELSKWVANHQDVLEGFSTELQSPLAKIIEAKADFAISKALGVLWDISEDTFSFASRKSTRTFRTPAEFLSTLASVYDPLGFFGHYTFVGKVLMAKVWREVNDWKKPMSLETKRQCEVWAAGLEKIAGCQLPRWYGTTRDSKVWLHVFGDASELGYSAVAYLKFSNKVVLVMSKTSVAPSKGLTIPRLELLAIWLAFKMADTILAELGEEVNIERLTIWTDSTVVQGMLKRRASEYNRFVAGRLGEIHELMDSEEFQQRKIEVRHVPTSKNPADRLTRGVDAATFNETFGEWVNGPEFLKEDEERWPKREPGKKNELSGEERAKGPPDVILATVSVPVQLDLEPTEFNDLASFYETFMNSKSLSPREYNKAEGTWIRQSQSNFFKKEIIACRSSGGRTSVKNGPLRGRLVFLDEDGILRDESRLQNATFLPWKQMYPAILHGKSPFARLVIRDAHRRMDHLGALATRGEVRRAFDLVNFGSTVRYEVYHCSHCRRVRPTAIVAAMAPLHKNRLQEGMGPFHSTGMDHFGPFNVVGGKCWGLLFMCLTTRAIHLEVTKSTDTPAFVMALDRFVNRRGRPKMIQSDGGTCFVAGAKDCKRMIEAESVRAHCAKEGIEFSVNPPGSPHWGGSWERMVAEVKKCLKASLSTAPKRLTYEAFNTFLVRAEYILNRRPIAFDDDGNPISPSRILGPANDASLPTDMSTVALVRLVGEMSKKFWQDWNRFYLNTFRVDRLSKGKRIVELKIGDRVLIDNSGANVFTKEWGHGKVIELLPSPDGTVRSVILETDKGRVKRGLNRLAVVENEILARPALQKPPPPVPPSVPPSGGVSQSGQGTAASIASLSGRQ